MCRVAPGRFFPRIGLPMFNPRYLLALLLSSSSLPALAMQPGDAVHPWTLLDQFDQPFTLGPDTRVLVVARSVGSARLFNQALEDAPKGFLEARHAAYIADVERMPSVARALAIPAMRSASYRILLDIEGRVAPRYEGAREGIQWLEVDNGRLKAERRFDDAVQLRQALDRLGP